MSNKRIYIYRTIVQRDDYDYERTLKDAFKSCERRGGIDIELKELAQFDEAPELGSNEVGIIVKLWTANENLD